MIRNPEFRRYVWLELTLHRTLAMPALILLLFVPLYTLSETGNTEAQKNISNLCLLLFGGLVFLWGSQLSSNGILSEVAGRTWDTQRMSPISPWSMTWGKLFGSSVYTWYGGALCLGIYVSLPHAPLFERLASALAMVLAGIWLQALSLLGSFLLVWKDSAGARSGGGVGIILVGLFLLAPVLGIVVDPDVRTSTLRWYGAEWIVFRFWLCSLTALAAWTVVGVYRLMRAELQLRGGPWVWLAFVLFLMVYAAGFVDGASSWTSPPEELLHRLLLAYLIGIGLVYVMALLDRKEFVAFRRLLHCAEGRDWKRVLEELPAWLATLPLVIGLCIGLVLLPQAGEGSPPQSFVIGMSLFLLRDLGILLGFNLSANPKRADVTALFYLVLLYTLAPGLLHAFGGDSLLGIFWPRLEGTLLTGTAPVLAQVLLVGLWVFARWSRAVEQLSDPSPVRAGVEIASGADR